MLSLAEVGRLFDGTADGVYIVTSAQRVVFWNDAAEQLTGIRREDAIGRQCYELIAGTDYDGWCFCRKDCPTIECARRGEAVSNYDVFARPGERKLWVNVGIVVAHAAEFSEPVAVHIFRDVTRMRRAEILAKETIATVARVTPPGSAADEGLDPCPVPQPLLTPREIEVLRLLASGANPRAIAQSLVLSPATVRNHIENLMGKLGVHSRLQAVVYAAHHGLLAPEGGAPPAS